MNIESAVKELQFMNIEVNMSPEVIELNELYKKYTTVLESCETAEQVMNCATYANLVSRRIDQILERT